MDYGTIAIISNFHMAVQYHKQENSRQSKKSLKNIYLQLTSSLKGELRRNAISKQEFDEMIDTYGKEYREVINNGKV